MIAVLSTFFIAFFFSFIGTIPPGTLNLTIIQLGLNQRVMVAWRMALAAAMVEYPYAWIAVEFQEYLAKSVEFTHSLHLVSALVMTSFGALALWASTRPSKLGKRFEDSGFRKGIAIALLNPLAIPFWVAMTAYLKSYKWISLSDNLEVHAYLAGVSFGTLVVLMLMASLAQRVIRYFKHDSLLKKTPGVVLILLGLYSFGEYILG